MGVPKELLTPAGRLRREQQDLIKAKKKDMGFTEAPRCCNNCGHCDVQREPTRPTHSSRWSYVRHCTPGDFRVQGSNACGRWVHADDIPA